VIASEVESRDRFSRVSDGRKVLFDEATGSVIGGRVVDDENLSGRRGLSEQGSKNSG
jgi:hypothetical protein